VAYIPAGKGVTLMDGELKLLGETLQGHCSEHLIPPPGGLSWADHDVNGTNQCLVPFVLFMQRLQRCAAEFVRTTE